MKLRLEEAVDAIHRSAAGAPAKIRVKLQRKGGGLETTVATALHGKLRRVNDTRTKHELATEIWDDVRGRLSQPVAQIRIDDPSGDIWFKLPLVVQPPTAPASAPVLLSADRLNSTRHHNWFRRCRTPCRSSQCATRL